jgi:predicted DNA-binding transcriptional regulator AlpA
LAKFAAILIVPGNAGLSRLKAEPDTRPLLVNAATAAKLCGRSLRTWRSWDATGRTPEPVRIGGSILWRLDEIQAWVEAGCPLRKDWTLIAKTHRRMT